MSSFQALMIQRKQTRRLLVIFMLSCFRTCYSILEIVHRHNALHSQFMSERREGEPWKSEVMGHPSFICNLSGNLVNGLLASKIGYMKKLWQIISIENQFSRDIPNTIGELTLLNNRLHSPVPKSFGTLISLCSPQVIGVT